MTTIKNKADCRKSMTKDLLQKPEDSEIGQNQSSTLYNFGFAPVEIIERFQWFCFKYSTLADAIDALLDRDRFLFNKYRFMTPPVLYQMLAKPTDNDSPLVVKKAMMSLHKYTKEGRYKSVADAIEELLISPESLDSYPYFTYSSCDCSNNGLSCSHTMITPAEEEALEKIADALFKKIILMAPATAKKNKQKKVTSPKKMKESEISAKLSVNTGKKPKTSKVFVPDPDYNPNTEHSHLLWSGKKLITSLSSHKEISSSGVTNPQHLNAPDSELNIPLERLIPEYVKPIPRSLLLHKFTGFQSDCDSQSLFMIQSLNLLPTKRFFEYLDCNEFKSAGDSISTMDYDYSN